MPTRICRNGYLACVRLVGVGNGNLGLTFDNKIFIIYSILYQSNKSQGTLTTHIWGQREKIFIGSSLAEFIFLSKKYL